MRLHFLFIFAAVLTMTNCVPQKRYLELEANAKKLQADLAKSDSLRKVLPAVSNDYLALEAQYLNALKTIDQLRSTNLYLNNSYQEILNLYDALLVQNREILNASSQLQDNLRGESLQLNENLQTQLRQLQLLKSELQMRKNRVAEMEVNFHQAISTHTEEISDLQNQLQARGQNLLLPARQPIQFSENISSNPEINSSATAGRIYITVSQDLIFPTNSTLLDPKGLQTLQAVATALLQEPEMDILIEGHTDNSSTEAKNWTLSVNRALSVCKALESYGLSPSRMTVAGRASFAPIASNSTESGRALNRRTEIILVPKSLTNGSMQKY